MEIISLHRLKAKSSKFPHGARVLIQIRDVFMTLNAALGAKSEVEFQKMLRTSSGSQNMNHLSLRNSENRLSGPAVELKANHLHFDCTVYFICDWFVTICSVGGTKTGLNHSFSSARFYMLSLVLIYKLKISPTLVSCGAVLLLEWKGQR